jgi:hypothetical protein
VQEEALPAAEPRGPISEPAPGGRALRPHAWVLIPIVAFVAYLFTFSDRPILLRENDRLAEADAADHGELIRSLDLRRQYGDEWNFEARQWGDRLQKHKLHHVLFHMVGHMLYRGFGTVGFPPALALHAVPALLGALNLVLLFSILGRQYPASRARPVYLVLAGFALSPWIYGSVTDSWIFSVTLVLGFLVLWLATAPRPWLAAAFVGVAMLNNPSLIALHVFTGLRAFADRRSWGRFVVTVGGAGLISVGVWLAGLLALSRFDADFAPGNIIAFGAFFRDRIQPKISILSFYYMKSVTTNQLINSFVSHQPDPTVPQDALLGTLRYSVFGTFVTFLYLAVVALAIRGAVREWRPRLREPGWLRALAGDHHSGVVAYGAALLAINLYVCAYSGYLYSCVMVPLVVMFLFRYLEPQSRTVRWFAYATTALIVVNSWLQIQLFRAALS